MHNTVDDWPRHAWDAPDYRCSHGNELGDCEVCWQLEQDEDESLWWHATMPVWWLTLEPKQQRLRRAA
jgi:hypothetical protein